MKTYKNSLDYSSDKTLKKSQEEDHKTPYHFKQALSKSLTDRIELSKRLLEKNHSFFLSLDNRYYIVLFDPIENELSLSTNTQSLGSGYSGTVSKIMQLTGNQFHRKVPGIALKLSYNITKNDIINEINILCFIHRFGKVQGVQAPPYQRLTTCKREGYLIEKYNSDLWDLYIAKQNGVTDPIEANLCLTDLIMGLKNLIDLEIYHGDIKPENSAVRINQYGKKEYFLADFGGAIDQRDLQKLIRGTISSTDYKPSDVTKEFLEIRKEVLASSTGTNFHIDNELAHRLKKNVISHDIYSLGLSLRHILSGGDQAVAQNKILLLLGKKKSALLEGMLHQEARIRIDKFNMLVMLLEQERHGSPSLETLERKEPLPHCYR